MALSSATLCSRSCVSLQQAGLLAHVALSSATPCSQSCARYMASHAYMRGVSCANKSHKLVMCGLPFRHAVSHTSYDQLAAGFLTTHQRKLWQRRLEVLTASGAASSAFVLRKFLLQGCFRCSRFTSSGGWLCPAQLFVLGAASRCSRQVCSPTWLCPPRLLALRAVLATWPHMRTCMESAVPTKT